MGGLQTNLPWFGAKFTLALGRLGARDQDLREFPIDWLPTRVLVWHPYIKRSYAGTETEMAGWHSGECVIVAKHWLGLWQRGCFGCERLLQEHVPACGRFGSIIPHESDNQIGNPG